MHEVSVSADILRKDYETDMNRRNLIANQGKKLPQLTLDGYRKVRAPKALMDGLLGFWKQQQGYITEESWPDGDSHFNYHEVKNDALMIGNKEKLLVEELVGPELEAWANNSKLEWTATYGLRVYRRGTLLENHVDRITTHAVSAIINVAQKVDVDWPLYIEDLAGRPHNVTMKPGDMVMYESAKLVHGRPYKFAGDYFTNIFVHYRPAKGWDFT